MKRNIKRTALMVALAMTVAVVASCGTTATTTTAPPSEPGNTSQATDVPETSEATETPTTPAPAPESVTVTAMLNQSRNYPGLQAMIKKLADEENIKIDLQVVPDDQFANLMKMRFNSGESADMVDYNIPDVYATINPDQYIADLSNESWVSRLAKPESYQYNGKVMAFPFQSLQGIHGFIYNKTVFADLGVEVPTTWDELLAVSEKIKTDGNGIAPIHFPKDTWVPQIIVNDNMTKALGMTGAHEFGQALQKNEAKWNEKPELAQVIDYYLALFDKGYVNEDFRSATYDDSIAAIGEGKAAMHFNGDFFAASVMEAFPDAQIGMFNVSMPTAKEDILSANDSSVGFVAHKDSPNLATVKKIFELWSTPEYMNLYFADRPGFPAFTDAEGGSIPSYLEELNTKYISTGKYARELNAELGIGKNTLDPYLWMYYIDAPGKNMTGQEILDKFQIDFEQYMKENQVPGF